MRRITSFLSAGITYPLDNVQEWRDSLAVSVPMVKKIIGLHGGFDVHGGDIAYADIGTIEGQIVIAVTDESEMTAKLDLLRSMRAGQKGRLYMQVEDDAEPIRFALARVDDIKSPQSEKAHTGLWCKAQASFQVNDPFWYTTGKESAAWGFFSWGGATWGGSAVPQSVSGTSSEFVESAGGSVDSPVRIQVQCGVGETAENITIQRLVEGEVVEAVTYAGVLVEGDNLEIDARELRVTLNTVDVFDDLSTLNNRWLSVEPGENDMRVLMDNVGDAASVTLRYLHRFV